MKLIYSSGYIAEISYESQLESTEKEFNLS